MMKRSFENPGKSSSMTMQPFRFRLDMAALQVNPSGGFKVGQVNPESPQTLETRWTITVILMSEIHVEITKVIFVL
jgi:hypothetical protein